MPKKASSAKRSKKSSPKRSALGRRLIAAAKESLAHVRGEIDLPSYVVNVPDTVDVAGVRKRLGMTQAAFADAFALDITALHAWEQGRRRPDRAARVLLAVIAKEPMAVRRALASEEEIA